MRIAASLTACFFFALALTAALTFVAVGICHKRGWVSKPRPDRWHAGTPAFFGGVPIWVGFVASDLIFLPRRDQYAWSLIAVCSLMFALGLTDDIRRLRPGLKLLAQFLVASLAAGCGFICPIFDSYALNVGISLLWIVGITNAFNLLDNMDGLSSGIALISSVWVLIFFFRAGDQAAARLISVIAGSIAGFLIFNFHPARIFMGDCGSLFLGCGMATTSLLPAHRYTTAKDLLVPVLILAVPIIDMVFVALSRRLRGQPISQGGTDHSSHRLVRLGLGERSAVSLLYVLAIISGAVGITVDHLSLVPATATVGLLTLAFCIVAAHLFFHDWKAISKSWTRTKAASVSVARSVS